MSDDRVLTEKETVKVLGGKFATFSLGKNEMKVSVLPGKWTAVKGGYFTVRLTGVVRKCREEKEDIPWWVKELGLEKPERFSDKIVKATNRHAVLIKAEDEKSLDLPDDFHFFCDTTMNPKKAHVRGLAGALEEGEGHPLHIPTNKEKMWKIRMEPIILPDHILRPCKGERYCTEDDWKNGETRPRNDFIKEANYGMGNYEHMVVRRVERHFTKSTLDHGEEFCPKKHLREEITSPIIALSSFTHENEKYLDTEAKVDNDILKYVSGPVSDNSYAPYTALQGGRNPGPDIHF